MEMSLEDLLDIEVSSVSKKPQTLSEVAAAVYVITQENIRLAWQAPKNLELAVVGQNLLEPEHQEFLSELVDVSIAIERSGHVQLRRAF